MISQSLEELARDLKQRRLIGDPPPVLLLGAGASVEAGIGAMTDLFEFVGCSDFNTFVAYINPRTAAERYRLLSQFLQARRPDQVTRGYRSLATMCEEGYFDLVLTTNLDPLLDDALAEARMWRKDCLLLVNGVVRTDRMRVLLGASTPRLKVLKLHGDLFHRFMAWTPDEMNTYVTSITTELDEALSGRDLLVVGHGLRDARILELTRRITEKDGVVWYTHPSSEPDLLRDLDKVRAVVDSRCVFEKLFPTLLLNVEPERLRVTEKPPEPPPPSPAPPAPTAAKPAAPAAAKPAAPAGKKSRPKHRKEDEVDGYTTTGAFGVELVGQSPAPSDHRKSGTDLPTITTISLFRELLGTSPPSSEWISPLSSTEPRAQTLDDLAAAVFGVGDYQGQSSATGFLLINPYCILCDRFPLEALGARKEVTIRSGRGETFLTRVLHKMKKSPFGPVQLEVPVGLRAPALEVDASPVARDDRVRVVVAAGNRPGISSGAVFDGIAQPLTIDPVGSVPGLIRLTLATKPGSSGAPVVDASFRVRGFVVASNSNLDKPESWMDPASHWFKDLREPKKR